MAQSEDVGDLIRYVACLPPHIVINEVMINPTWNRGYVADAGSRRRPDMTRDHQGEGAGSLRRGHLCLGRMLAGTRAAASARYLVSANLSGHDSHGVVRVPRYAAVKKDGIVVADRHGRRR